MVKKLDFLKSQKRLVLMLFDASNYSRVPGCLLKRLKGIWRRREPRTASTSHIRAGFRPPETDPKWSKNLISSKSQKRLVLMLFAELVWYGKLLKICTTKFLPVNLYHKKIPQKIAFLEHFFKKIPQKIPQNIEPYDTGKSYLSLCSCSFLNKN